MRSIDQFSRKTFTVDMKNTLYKNLKNDIIEVLGEVEQNLKTFISNLLDDKLLTEDEKYLRKRPFVRFSTYVKICYEKLGILSIDKKHDGIDFHIDKPGIPIIILGEKIGGAIDLTPRIIEKCNEPEINYIKDTLIEIYQLTQRIKHFGEDIGISPKTWSGNAFENVRTIGGLYKLNKDYYERLTQLYPNIFYIEKSDIEKKLIELRKLLGY